jgi:hypothetical protein
LKRPILLSVQELIVVIQLTDTTGDQTDCPEGHHVFYARAFARIVSQPRALVDLRKKQDEDYPEIAVWEQIVEKIIDYSNVVHLRCICMTNRYSGAERLRADKKS